MGLKEVDAQLFVLQATPPLEVSIEALQQALGEAERAGVEEFKLARGRKKVKYAGRVQGENQERMKEQKEFDEWRQEADDNAALHSQFGYAALQAREHNMKVLGTSSKAPM